MANFRLIENPRLLASLIVISSDCGEARWVLTEYLGHPVIGNLRAYQEALDKQLEARRRKLESKFGVLS